MTKSVLSKDVKDVYIFGCGDLGEISLKVCNHYGVNVLGFIVSKAVEDVFCGKHVYSPEEACKNNWDAFIIPAIFNDDVERSVIEELIHVGFTNFISKKEVLDKYISDNIKPISFRFYDGVIDVQTVTIAVTERCSLRCKYCGQYMPYLEKPIDYDADMVIDQMERFAQAVDRIRFLSLIGGEPFMHPELLKIVKEVVEINNLEQIAITTNGTIAPDDSFMKLLAEYPNKLFLKVSDYGNGNRRLNKIKEKCVEFDVSMEMYKTAQEPKGKWTKTRVPEYQGRTTVADRNAYITCKATEFCPFIRDGKLYKCATAAWGERLGKIPQNAANYVDLMADEDKCGSLRERIKEYWISTAEIDACSYCYMGALEETGMGEQILEENYSLEKYIKEVNV